MGRPAGHRNAAFAEKRGELVGAALGAVLHGGAGQSLRELATAMGTSPSNLRHYFGDREALLTEVAAAMERLGEPHARRAASPPEGPVEDVLVGFLEGLVRAWRGFGVDRMHTTTLREGLGDPRLGPAYVSHLLEPMLATVETLLGVLVARGDLPALDARIGALGLAGPVLLALLHQDGLGGDRCRPLDVPAFLRPHVHAWLQGYGPR